MLVLKDESGKEYKFETYNNLLVQEGTITVINKRVETERTTHETKYAELETKHKDLNTQHEELRKKHMTAEELAADSEKKRVLRENELIAEKDKLQARYKQFRIDSELLNEIAGFKTESGDEPYNPKQISKLLRDEYDEVDLLNDTEVVFKKGTSTTTVKDAVKTFLQSEANANLMKSGIKPGGDTQQTGVGGTGKTMKRSDWEKLQPEAQMQVVTDKIQIVD